MLLLVLQVFVICNNTEEQYQGARLTPRSFEVRAHNKLAPDEWTGFAYGSRWDIFSYGVWLGSLNMKGQVIIAYK